MYPCKNVDSRRGYEIQGRSPDEERATDDGWECGSTRDSNTRVVFQKGRGALFHVHMNRQESEKRQGRTREAESGKYQEKGQEKARGA